MIIYLLHMHIEIDRHLKFLFTCLIVFKAHTTILCILIAGIIQYCP